MKLKKSKKNKNNNNTHKNEYPDSNNPFANEPEVKLEAKKEKKKKKKEKKAKKGKRERVLSKSVETQIKDGKINSNDVTIINDVTENKQKNISLIDNKVETLKSQRIMQLKQDKPFKSPNVKTEPSKLAQQKNLNTAKPTQPKSSIQVKETVTDEIISVPTVKVTKPDNEASSVRRHRTSSIVISSRERRKRKGLKKLKKWKKNKNKKLETVEKDKTVPADFNPKPKNSNETQLNDQVFQQVEEVKEIAHRNLSVQLAQRQSALIEAVENTDKLQDFANTFAKVSNETRLKKQSQATCCGVFSKYRACWYICNCTRGIKQKRKKKLVDLDAAKEQSRAFADLQDSDEIYEAATLPNKPFLRVKQRIIENDKRRVSLGDKRSSTSSILVGIRKSRIMQSISMASLPTVPPILKKNRIVSRDRKATSVSALEDLIKKRDKDIKQFATQFDGDEEQQKVMELLMLDHN